MISKYIQDILENSNIKIRDINTFLTAGSFNYQNSIVFFDKLYGVHSVDVLLYYINDISEFKIKYNKDPIFYFDFFQSYLIEIFKIWLAMLKLETSNHSVTVNFLCDILFLLSIFLILILNDYSYGFPR